MRPQAGKQKLFDAAMTLFERNGYFATTVEQITSEAGVSKGLVYNYFKSKDELLVGLIEDYTEKMQAVAGAFEAEGSGESIEVRLSSFIDRYFLFLKDNKRFLKLQLTLILMPELKGIVGKAQQKRAEMLLKMTSSWFSRAGIERAKHRARLFLAMLDGVALHYLSIYERYPLMAMKPLMVASAMGLCKNTGEEK